MWRTAGGQALFCWHDHLDRAWPKGHHSLAPNACAGGQGMAPGGLCEAQVSISRNCPHVTVRMSARQLSLRRPSGATLVRPSSRGSVSHSPTVFRICL